MRSAITFSLLLAAVFAQGPASTNTTPAELAIAEARKTIAARPGQPDAYDALATALLRRARETSDPIYVQQADEAARQSLRLASDNFESLKTQVSVLLAKHEYSEALTRAEALNKRAPDDVMVYGLLAQADAELGNYGNAEKSADWMLNLRPGNLPALLVTGYLREFFGDTDGACEVLELALQSTAPGETEQSAWILTRMAHVRLAAGNADAAEKLDEQALSTFPGYPEALSGLIEARFAQKRYDEAISMIKQPGQPAPRAATLYRLAEGLELADRTSEAKQGFTEFEAKATAESASKDNANRELIFYYVDHAHDPARALKLAKSEIAWRHDVYTLDAYAWALSANGQDAEARKQLETALAVGIRNASLFRHAGEIALKLKDISTARQYLKQSLKLNGASSDQARASLAAISQATLQ